MEYIEKKLEDKMREGARIVLFLFMFQRKSVAIDGPTSWLQFPLGVPSSCALVPPPLPSVSPLAVERLPLIPGFHFQPIVGFFWSFTKYSL